MEFLRHNPKVIKYTHKIDEDEYVQCLLDRKERRKFDLLL